MKQRLQEINVVDVYKINPFTTNDIPPAKNYPFKTMETMEQTMEQCVKYV